MRVGERGSSQFPREAAPGEGFADALRRARRDGADPRATLRPQPRRAPSRASPADDRRESVVSDARFASSPDAALVAGRPDAPPTPELAALARTLPVAVAAEAARHGAPLALSFGRALDVELRSGAAGVELLLRPEPRLARMVEAELPALLAAMRVRGVAVARAEVRPRGGTARRPR